MLECFTDWETLSNGILVRRKTYWSEWEVESWSQEVPWLATINVGSWHYSNRGSATKEEAVKDLLKYMHEQKKSHENQLEFQKTRLKELTEYLEKQDG